MAKIGNPFRRMIGELRANAARISRSAGLIAILVVTGTTSPSALAAPPKALDFALNDLPQAGLATTTFPARAAATTVTPRLDEAQMPAHMPLPDLGEPADVALSPAKASAMGDRFVGQLYAAGDIVDDPELRAYLSAIGWRLARYGTQRPMHFRFYPIASNALNAFAMPGGDIGVNIGTLVAVHNVSELAAVMAHEEGHETQNHFARAANQSILPTVATWAGVLAAIAASTVAGGGGGDSAMGAVLAGESLNAQRGINYQRTHEWEADRTGIQTLALAGYDPRAMAELFAQMQSQTQLYGAVPAELIDHPTNSARVAAATLSADQDPPVTVPYSISFHLMRARARVVAASLPATVLRYFTAHRDHGETTPGDRYGLAMTQHLIGEDGRAWDTLQPLLKAWPDQPDVLLLESRILSGLRKPHAALRIDEQLLTVQPDYEPVILRTAADLLATHQAERAANLLLTHHPLFATDPRTYQLLAKAEGAMGHRGAEVFDTASYEESRRNPRAALHFVKVGLRMSHLSPDASARLAALRQQLTQSLSEQPGW
ncbi:MAG TPA: M48 family metalloprotease [Nevskiaceae bacterium]|nr:M48 family metalloprotease [Nevskiaceae bacterium]